MLVGIALVISFVLGTLLGVIVAWRRGSRLDAILSPLFTFLSAIPYFWLALILLYVLGFLLNWFPINGGFHNANTLPGFDPAFIFNAFLHGVLPPFTIVI